MSLVVSVYPKILDGGERLEWSMSTCGCNEEDFGGLKFLSTFVSISCCRLLSLSNLLSLREKSCEIWIVFTICFSFQQVVFLTGLFVGFCIINCTSVSFT